MPNTLQETLKEIQILLGKPQRKLAGALKYYLNFLSVKENGFKETDTNHKGEKMQSIHHKKITWVDVQNPTRKEISQLAQEYPFHPLHLEDCVSKGQSAKIEKNDEDKYVFLLLRFPTLNREKKVVVNQICFFLGQNYLVTVHENANNILSNIFNDCKENTQQREVYIDNSPNHLIYAIIKKLTDDLSLLLQTILQEVEEAEDIVFDDKVTGSYMIGQLRRKILISRKAISPLRTLIDEIPAKIGKFSKTNLSVYFDDISDQINKVWETLEESRETVDIYKDADFIISSEKTNRILSVLTIIFTLTIPATIVGTFYGMNIRLPGGIEDGSWTFLGRYTTFFVVLIASAVPALLMQLYFRKRGWS